jgi:hypothetical protein
VLFPVAVNDIYSLQKKEHKLGNEERPEEIGNWQKCG